MRVNDKFPWTKEFQYEFQPDDSCDYVAPSEENCKDGRCLVNAIKHFWTRLTTPEHEVYMKYEKNTRLTDADQVRFLVSLLGNLANPIHLGYASDEAGKKLHVKYHGVDMTLQQVWDSAIVDNMIKDASNSWYSGWTHVNSVKNLYEEEKRQFAELGALEMFDKWAKEAAKLVCEKVYKDPFSHKKITNGDSIEMALEGQWKSTLRHQILVGGARLAIVLNALLEHKSAAELKGGSYVKEVEEEEKKRATNSHALTHETMFKNFLTNAAILSVVLALFAFIERKTLLASSNLHKPVPGAADTISKSN